MQEQLKPCPFCGGQNCRPTSAWVAGYFYVLCPECRAIGPSDQSREAAVCRWNTRKGEEAAQDDLK